VTLGLIFAVGPFGLAIGLGGVFGMVIDLVLLHRRPGASTGMAGCCRSATRRDELKGAEAIDRRRCCKETPIKTIHTDLLEIALRRGGPDNGRPVLLLHGCRIALRLECIAPRLHAAGWRTIAPYLRGSGPTRFLSDKTPRVGAGLASRRTRSTLQTGLRSTASISSVTMGSQSRLHRRGTVSGTGYLRDRSGPRVSNRRAALRFHRLIKQGASGTSGSCASMVERPGFRRVPSSSRASSGRPGVPPGWFTDVDFAKAAESFSNPDWALITRNAYRSRWREGEAWDSRYEPLQRKLYEVEAISTPTLMIQGASDSCDPPSLSEGLERHFSGGYERVLASMASGISLIGGPAAVATAILRHLRSRDDESDI